MNLIQQVTNDTLQKQTLTLKDGTTFTIVLYFVPMQYGWFIQKLTYKTFELNNVRVTNSPNMLYQFRNQIPFGIACFSKDDREPSQQNDFSTGASKLYVLTQDDVTAYTRTLSGEV